MSIQFLDAVHSCIHVLVGTVQQADGTERLQSHLDSVQDLCQGRETDAETRNTDVTGGLGGETRPGLYQTQRKAGRLLHAGYGSGSGLLDIVSGMAAMGLRQRRQCLRRSRLNLSSGSRLVSST